MLASVLTQRFSQCFPVFDAKTECFEESSFSRTIRMNRIQEIIHNFFVLDN